MSWAKIVATIGIVGGIALGTASVALAEPGDQVCSGTHIEGGNFDSITITAPEGQLISGYCVKAGSAEQGLGPEYVTLDPPVAEVTISHSSGKDISHYVVTYTPVSTPTPTPTVSVTPSESPTPSQTPTPSETSTPTPTTSSTPTPSVSVTPSFPTPVQFSFDDAVAPPTCEEAGALLVDAFPGVTITVDPAFDGPGIYTLTATLDDPEDTSWEDGTNEPKIREVTVAGATGFQSEDPDAECYVATATPTPTATSTASVPPVTVTTTPPLGSVATVVPAYSPTGSLAQTGTDMLAPAALGLLALGAGGAAVAFANRKKGLHA